MVAGRESSVPHIVTDQSVSLKYTDWFSGPRALSREGGRCYSLEQLTNGSERSEIKINELDLSKSEDKEEK